MADITEWLAARQLDSLAPVMAENEIDLDVLFDLTDDDLKEIGLTLGARKRLRAAIAAADAPEAPAAKAAAGDAERRQLTTMFVDLVGSTALSGRLDPEDMREVITAYQNAVAGVVTRYEGQVAKYMGDGVLCYFGWPRAHEDDAERAARSGLEIVRALAGLNTPQGEALAVRVGVATGLVVVGDLIGEGSAQEEAVVGDTPNLAARLQGVAGPGEVVIADNTRQLVGDRFELDDLGPQELKGVDRPAGAWRVRAERSLASRFEAHAHEPVLPLVGRDHELGLVMDRWTRALGGEGQVVALIGEAGIGKSRLTRAVIDAAAATDHFRISYHCSPYHTDSSFFPMIQQLTNAAGIAEGDATETRLDKLEASLRAADPRIIAELMRIDGAQRYGELNLTPQQIRARILEATSDEVRALAREKPVLLVVEDAHWIDASTLAAIEACLDKIADQRAMILITGRPTFEHPFGGHPIVTRLTLNRLGAAQTASVLAEITGGKSLPPELVAEIAARTDGVPLFIEELTKTILESGELRETETAYELTGPLSRVTIPATLHDSLMARIDRLQPVKEVAQMAACIGRHFDRVALGQIARMDEAKLDDALRQLEAAELVFRRGAAAEAAYVFKHALVRDVAYESLLKRRRQEIHGRLVEVFEADAKAPPELIAHHATEAGLFEKAVDLWARAGAVAQARPAYDEAINHLNMAIRTVAPLLGEAAWREKELRFLVQLAQIYIAKIGYSSTEAAEAFTMALDRIGETDDPELRVAIYYGTWIGPYIGARLTEGQQVADRLVTELSGEADPVPRLISRRMRGANLISVGRPREALEDLAVAYDLYRSAEITDFAAKFAQDPGVQIWCYQLLALWVVGEEEEALALSDRMLDRARMLKHANTICYAGLHDVTLSIWRGDVARGRAVNDEMRRIASEHQMSLWLTFVAIHDAVFDCMEDAPGAPERLNAAEAKYIADGAGLWLSLYRSEQAKAYLRRGDSVDAAAVVEAALADMRATGETWAEAELRRIEGDIRQAADEREAAVAAYQAAVDIARAQGAEALARRAARSLALTEGG